VLAKGYVDRVEIACRGETIATHARSYDTAYNGLVAYAGTYSIERDIVSHRVDASWNQAWTGTTQSRQFKIDGKTLRITTVPAKSPITGREDISVLVWTKVE
jgi:hypothetical protein